MKLTYHASVVRKERIEAIEKKIGFGQIIKENYYHGTYNFLTDTGVILIFDDDRITLVTAYVATMREVTKIYGNPNKIPKFLSKKVRHNESLYVKDGKTIF